jgi:anti-sigma B factor antagonist
VDSVAVVTLTGDLNAHSADTVQFDVASVMPAHTEVLLDLSEVAHLTSAVLRTLLLLYRQGQCLDSAVALVGLSAELRNVLSATGFLDFFRVADSVPDGIELLTREAERKERVDA